MCSLLCCADGTPPFHFHLAALNSKLFLELHLSDWCLPGKHRLVAVATSCSKGGSGMGCCVTASWSPCTATVCSRPETCNQMDAITRHFPRARVHPPANPRCQACPFRSLYLHHSGVESHGDTVPLLVPK